MNMREELTKLYNTLLTIETKGAHTKTMADCLRFTEQLIAQAEVTEAIGPKEVNNEK